MSGLTQADVGKEVFASGTDPSTVTLLPGTHAVLIGTVAEFESATRAIIKWGPSTGVAGAVYTVTNHTPDKTYDANASTNAELADVLGSLLLDLEQKGIIKATVS